MKRLIAIMVSVNIFGFIICISISENARFYVYDFIAQRFAKTNIVFIGDSITREGSIWAYKLGRYNFDTVNLGRGGLATSQMATYVLRRAIELKPKYAFIMAGINDSPFIPSGSSECLLSICKTNYLYILDSLRSEGIEPIIQLTLYRRSEKKIDFIDALNAFLISYAHRNNISVIDLNKKVCANKSLLDEFTTDGVHLSAMAYSIWTDEIKNVLKDIPF